MDILESLRYEMRRRIVTVAGIVSQEQYQREWKNAPDNVDLYIRETVMEYTREEDSQASELITALCEYAGMQVSCGIDAFQVFDSHAALTPCDEYGQFSGAWISEILKSIDGRARTAVFAGGMSRRFAELMPIGADIYSMDSAMPLSTLLNTWEGRYALQGNLDPSALVNDTPEEVARKTTHIISDMNPYGRHIFNLGHGITPDAKIENVEAMCEAVKNYGRL